MKKKLLTSVWSSMQGSDTMDMSRMNPIGTPAKETLIMEWTFDGTGLRAHWKKFSSVSSTQQIPAKLSIG